MAVEAAGSRGGNSGAGRRRAQGRWRRILTWTAIALPLLLLGGFIAAGWYYSDQIRADLLTARHAPPEYEIRVIEVAGDRVVLERTDDTLLRGVYGLEWPDGYGQIADITDTGRSRVERMFRLLEGLLSAGDRVRVRSGAFPENPDRAFGISFEEVAYEAEMGRFPAWYVDGTDDTWVVFVHGKGASREEALRMLPTVAELGYPSLVITYRNDPEASPSPDHRYHFGETEWQDLDGAVRFALGRGAADIVLVGYSMGGAIVTNFLLRSDLVGRVRGAILEAPVLDVSAAVDLEGANRGLPQFLTSFAKWLASLRFDVDWDAWDLTDEAQAISVPMLLIHGDVDDTAPIEVSDRLAAARPDTVSYLRASGAGHVRAWNVDSAAYEAAVRNFLKGIGS